jgi:hypothetical protein
VREGPGLRKTTDKNRTQEEINKLVEEAYDEECVEQWLERLEGLDDGLTTGESSMWNQAVMWWFSIQYGYIKASETLHKELSKELGGHVKLDGRKAWDAAMKVVSACTFPAEVKRKLERHARWEDGGLVLKDSG